MSDTIFPYYYPTTVVMIDDNKDFLTNCSLHLDPKLACRLFSSPHKGLEFINKDPDSPPLFQRCLTHHKNVVDSTVTDHLFFLDLQLIEREVSNVNRFEDISVVIVDYDMPGINGLEVCKRIKNPSVKKVLFTGVADEHLAVKAFNEGLIDRFVVKNQSNALDVINEVVVSLQKAYFAQIAHLMNSTLSMASPSFVKDPLFESFFSQLLKNQQFVEYYLVEDPSGFLLLTETGELSRLLVLTRQDIEKQWHYANSKKVPSQLLDKLKQGKVVPYFWEVIDDDCDEGYDWNDYFYPAQILESDETYYYSLLDNPPVDIEFEQQSANYSAYLERLDDELEV